MKKILLSVIAMAALAACQVKQVKEQPIANVEGTAVYGDSIKNDQVISINSIQTTMKDEPKMDMKIRGVVDEVCPKKGCWMMMKQDNGDVIRITFKDYKIFVPKDLAGKEVVLDGFAYADTVSVEKLKHYAEDAGKSAEEIAKITASKKSVAFEAKGVVVLN